MGNKSPECSSTGSTHSQTKNSTLDSYFTLQVKLLLWKQYLLFSRNLKSTLFQIFTPVCICIFLVLLQQLATYSMSTMTDKHPPDLSLSKIPKCYGSGCITLGIAYTSPMTTKMSEHILSYIAENNDLKINDDIKVIANNYDDMIDYLAKYTNRTQTCLLLCTGPFKPPPNPIYNDTIICDMDLPEARFYMYSILINSTITPLMYFSGYNSPQPVDYASLAVKRSIDEAIISFYSNGKYNKTIVTNVQSFPLPTNRWMSGYDIVTAAGAFYFFIPPMVTFVVLLIEIVREKEYKLRHGLSMMGMGHGPYWFSWFLTGIIFILIVSNSLIISGLACVFDLFLHAPYPILIMLFGFFSISMMCLAFLMSTMLTTTKSAYTTSYAIILAGLVLQFLLSNIDMIYLIYGDDVATWIKIVRIFLAFYPPFNFAKAFGDIALKSSSHYSTKSKRWVSGDDYTWNDLTHTIHATIQGSKVTVPSTFITFMILIGNSLMLGSIAWYLDHVLPSNRGTPDKWYFFITPRYWGCKRSNRKKSVNISLQDLTTNFRIQDPSIISSNPSGFSEPGVSINDLGKIFKNTKFCGPSSQIHAVNNFSLSIEKRELLAILGHNGAGKSTLISLLTGLAKPSYGSASIFGLDISEDMKEIRKILGVCPQHDILWNELTPREHLILFGRMKNLPYDRVCKEADEKLRQVKLDYVRNKLVGTFSGGMKRRLSLAISGVGDPRIIILDEPTTGMDPINRRNAWKLIQEMKKDRVMILTTHSMEEADVLSDRVCVVVDGMLKCLGTPLYLKNNYGDGFRITLISKHPDELCQLISRTFPSSRLIDSSGGSLVISLPLDRKDEIQSFFLTMEGHQNLNLRILIEDWGLSNTTLEEVFMRVTGKKEQAH